VALAAVKTDTPATLADRIAEAQRAEVRPRNRLAELQGQFDGALDEKRRGWQARVTAGEAEYVPGRIRGRTRPRASSTPCR
jgi:hypothetical protein